MKIGTLSFEIQNRDQGLVIVPDGHDRVEAIVQIIGERQPDVLVCAGFTLDDRKQLDELGEKLTKAGSKTTVILEVKADSAGHCVKTTDGVSRINVWLDGGWSSLPPQVLVYGEDADDRDLVAAFENLLDEREFSAKGLKFGALICGEIGIVRGERGIVSQRTAEWVDGLDVIVNPTHTRMSYSGRLEAKRATLGSSGRLYISVSNWETKVGRQRPTDTLHTVYRNGAREEMLPVGFEERLAVNEDEFVYREYDWVR